MSDTEFETLLAKLPGPLSRCAIYEGRDGIGSSLWNTVFIRYGAELISTTCADEETATQLVNRLRRVRSAAHSVEGQQ